jgi:hypothetical protein
VTARAHPHHTDRGATVTTPAPLTLQQLDEIQARAQAATPGPWTTDGWEIYQGAEEDSPNLLTWVGETCRADDYDGSRRDAEFIAHARTDVPALLDELKQARAAIARVRRLCADPVHQYTVHRSDVLAALDEPAAPAP